MIFKKLKLTVLSIVALVATQTLMAQQSSLYTMTLWNQLIVNPAYAGTRDALSASLVSRHQWVGFDGAPSTQVLSVHTPLPNDNVGLGLSVINDHIGVTNNTGVFGDFSYKIRVTEKARLSLGLRAGFNIFQADLRSEDAIEINDPAFEKNVENQLNPNFGLAAYYYSDRGYVGISVPELLQNKFNAGNYNNDSDLDESARHMYLLAGYVFSLSSDSASLMFKPTTVVRYLQDAPVSFDVTANFLIKQKLWLGAGYRYKDSFSGIISFRFTDHLQAGYSYDFGISDLSSYHNGTHEIMISYDFFKQEIKTMNPRYF